MIKFSGPAFQGVDNRLMSLQLVSQGLTSAIMFTADGETVQPAEVFYKKAILVERGSFRPVTLATNDMLDGARDIFSLLLSARDEDGHALSDEELRDELLTLVLAGHETTANSLAWTFERLIRAPAPYARLRELARAGAGAEAEAGEYVEATIHEGMRVRPVIPMIVRMAKRRWRLGEYVIPADTPVAVSIVALHHREDTYPHPHAFKPERFLARKPGTYTWLPFGGGTRRCLGASFAQMEMRVVLRRVLERTVLRAADPEPEEVEFRAITLAPKNGTRVVLERRD